MSETPKSGVAPGLVADPSEVNVAATEEVMPHPEQPPIDDAASGLPEDPEDKMTDNS